LDQGHLVVAPVNGNHQVFLAKKKKSEVEEKKVFLRKELESRHMSVLGEELAQLVLIRCGDVGNVERGGGRADVLVVFGPGNLEAVEFRGGVVLVKGT